MNRLFFIILWLALLFGACTHQGEETDQVPMKKEETKGIIFPRAFAFAADDLGWNTGKNDGDLDGQGPFRAGVDRKMDLEDYKPIVEVGKALGIRIQCLFILAEMDRENILRKYPTTTQMGANWDNSANVNDEQLAIMQFVKDNAAYMEFGLHGVGHEYWVDGVRKRAEWYCQQDDHPWPEKSVRQHIQCFKDIMAQYGLSKENGQSFPESFVPCAYGYYWNPGQAYSTGKVMADNGVKYVNTLFDYIRELNPPEGPNGGGFDNGVHVINRINYGNEWYQYDTLPSVPVEEQATDIIETHWPNWLAQDNFLQEQTTQRFIAYYNKIRQMPGRYLAKNTEQLHSQWLYKKYATVKEVSPGEVIIDNSNMPDDAYHNNILGTMVLKLRLPAGQHISRINLDGQALGVYQEEAGFGLIHLPVLAQKKYKLTYETGNSRPEVFIDHQGSFNVYEFTPAAKNATAKIRMYGTQEVRFVGVEPPKRIQSDNPNLVVVSSNYDPEKHTLKVILSARDMQGETGTIRLSGE